jgi:hypothetical protein
MKFEDICHKGRCEVCNKETDVVVYASLLGAVSYAYCKDCATKGLEPYGSMVAYIACAGKFPEEIHSAYVGQIRYILNELGKTEEEFIADVEHQHEEMIDYFNTYYDYDEGEEDGE